MHFKVWFVSSTILVIYFLQNYSDLKNGCLVCVPQDVSSKLFREPVDCEMCIDVFQVDKVQNISPWHFNEFYYSKKRPVIVTDATETWKALEVFSFDFFKNIFLTTEGAIEEQLNCQFFPYQTEFKSLFEALNMDKNRSELVPGTKPWYIGWSNCNNEIAKELSKYYDAPYFLPPTSENMALSWIFMGGPGFGAQMHIDNVHYPSWQVQLKGRKKWILAPPPECYFVCKKIEVILQPKDIIVVDTNRWYHQTIVLPGEISITIGAEFD